MSITYPKIRSLWRRQNAKPFDLIVGNYSLPEFEYLANLDWVFCEKVDGTNVRVIWDGHNVVFGGHTVKTQMQTNMLAALNDQFSGEAVEQKFEESFGETPVTLFGEGYGPGVQKGGNYREDLGFVLFDIWCGCWLKQDDAREIASKFDVDTVPIVGTGTLEQFSKYVEGRPQSVWGEFTAEGAVARPAVDLSDRRGRRIITKLKCNDFEIS